MSRPALVRRSELAEKPFPFIDLAAQQRRLGDSVERAIGRVLSHGQYIMGPEVFALERELAAFSGAKEVISCASGTDALALLLMAKGLRAGQAVLCPSFTFAATAEVVAWFGATPIFLDVEPDTFNLDPRAIALGSETARKLSLEAVGVIAVDLFGQPADYAELTQQCDAHGLWLLDDAAQSFGAEYQGRKIGTFGFATATSFFPAKPLGCYGDGGAIFTDDAKLAAILRSLRVHGQGDDRYDNVRIGMNGRMDTIQAAVLLEKLRIFPEEIEGRDRIAARYNEMLAGVAAVPVVRSDRTSIWAQYTIKVDASRRDAVAASLKAKGIPTAIYYPKPLHRQTAYEGFPCTGNGLPVSDALAQEVLSLPMHPYLESDLQDRIVEAMRAALVN
jgi:dTDP-4-amino-4,6-dideoxygalactose transaminase